MAHLTKITAAAANASANAVGALANNGWLRLYSGAQPATADTAVGAQVLLAELRLSATAFGAAAGGIITAAAITSDIDANATGTAAWYRVFKADGTTPVWDGTVGLSGCDINMNAVDIQIHAQIDCGSFFYTQPEA